MLDVESSESPTYGESRKAVPTTVIWLHKLPSIIPSNDRWSSWIRKIAESAQTNKEVLFGARVAGEIYGIGSRMEQRLHRAGIFTVAQLWNAMPFQLRRGWGGINGVLFHQMLHGVDIQPPSSRYSERNHACKAG